MAHRAEDLIGQYLTDLFAPAAEAAAPERARPVEPAPAEKPEPLTPGPSPAALKPIQASAGDKHPPQAPVYSQASPANLPSPAEVTLAEPARQQLQQLLNSAWQAPVQVQDPVQGQSQAIAPVAPVAPEPTPPIAPIDPPAVAAPHINASAVAGKPAWATKTFDTLLVDVAGLKLAIPLVVLGHIFQVQDGFSHLPGQGPLFLGTLNTPRGPLRVINTALLVMPERYEAAFVEQVQFVVSLAAESAKGQPWQLALAVNRVAQPVSLACDDVVWRGERSKRPWLLGTVKSQMCALLDVEVIGQMLVGAASA